MARPLQKKKNKSSLPRVRQKPKSKAVNIKSNPLVAAHWDQSLTLRQNYKNLGLSSRLNSSTGGIEKPYKNRTTSAANAEREGLGVARNKRGTQLQPAMVKVSRDERGAIIGIVRDAKKEAHKRRNNPLNDPLNDLSSDSTDNDESGDEEIATQQSRTSKVGIISELEDSAKYEKRKGPRKQSQREREWIERLVGVHGEDYGAMVRDRRLNPMQQSEGDLRRRVAVWRKERARGEGGGGGEEEEEIMD